MSTAKPATMLRKQRVRTLWISDVHLGTRDCQAERLATFLKQYHADRIYLVGDIIDGWKLRGGIYWPQAHTNVIRRLLTLSKRGCEVIYVTGNHDEFLRRYSTLILGNIQLVDEAVHTTADGRQLLVIHGDQFDVITRYHRWLAFLGDSAYEFTLTLNRWLNHWRERWGYGYWSLSAYLKHKVKTAVNFISDFEQAIAHECVRRGFDGASCATPPPAMLAAPCGSHRVRRHRAAGRGAMTRPSLHPPPDARRPAGRAPPPRRASAEPAPDGVGLAARNAPGGGTRLVSPRMRRLRHSRQAQGGTPPACEADGDDVGTARRESDAETQRRRSRRPPSASRRRERNRRRAAPRAAGRHRRMRRGADLAASMPEGGAVKPRTGDGALKKVQRVRPQRKARRVPRRNGCRPKAAPRRLDWCPPPGLADTGMRHFHGA